MDPFEAHPADAGRRHFLIFRHGSRGGVIATNSRQCCRGHAHAVHLVSPLVQSCLWNPGRIS